MRHFFGIVLLSILVRPLLYLLGVMALCAFLAGVAGWINSPENAALGAVR